ncbi:hypothetical protein [Victivallis sp. Marseille-Q1083]|uniref:hypothetical protein n=1 Tax=Victivallis sp. Marseille-Q1083 TaxID=2717288 RepID=UPI00158B25B9|nr:hypothetical protein [Victivallis sp. Marseille-Q1083]
MNEQPCFSKEAGIILFSTKQSQFKIADGIAIIGGFLTNIVTSSQCGMAIPKGQINRQRINAAYSEYGHNWKTNLKKMEHEHWPDRPNHFSHRILAAP